MRDDEGEAATAAVLSEVNERDATCWRLRRKLSGGFQSGAWLLDDGAGRQVVLKWSASADWAPTVLAAAAVVTAARRRGWPTPAWLSWGRTSLGFPYQVQEFVLGATQEVVSDDWLDLVLPVVAGQAGLGTDGMRNWSDYDHDVVFGGENGNRRLVAASGPGGAVFDDAVTRVTRDRRQVRLPAADLVHGDLNPGNVLVAGGEVAALIDVEAVGRGTRLHDLSTLLCYASIWGEADVIDRLIDACRAVAGPGWLEITASAVAIDLLAFGVRHWAAGDLDDICRVTAVLLLRLDGS